VILQNDYVQSFCYTRLRRTVFQVNFSLFNDKKCKKDENRSSEVIVYNFNSRKSTTTQIIYLSVSVFDHDIAYKIDKNEIKAALWSSS
jgi:hypothetical protein